jgi:hypothetical protein
VAENSNIEWTDHTFNPWTGCTKVGPGCDNCYAEAMAAQAAGTLTREDLADAERALAIARENARLSNGPIGGLNGMADASMWVQQLEQIVQAARGGSVGVGTGSNLSLGKGSGSGSSAVAQPRTVNISIGGRTTPVTAASDTDADALESVLRQIEDAANRSGG